MERERTSVEGGEDDGEQEARRRLMDKICVFEQWGARRRTGRSLDEEEAEENETVFYLVAQPAAK
jgi:hypothetical protein